MSDDLVKRLRSKLPGIETPAMRGDNLAITLASFFEPQVEDETLDDSETWKKGAVDATDEVLDAIHAHYADRIEALEAANAWLPIETAPRDGTVIDLWHEEFGRQADCRWGYIEHCCGEAGRYCDSDWHSETEGWVDTSMNERFFGEVDFTHWRPLPAPPASAKGDG